DVHLPNDVLFYTAKRAGQAGRNGDTIGTLACADFECSANVRKRPPVAYIGFDVEAARQQRMSFSVRGSMRSPVLVVKGRGMIRRDG
ncbi:FBP domain-containing protein, partial [Rhizobium johnstonii]|uniref:FBP domain-containing protein n=1 Tax=Rhizobium johnstonii TaxID=3019933 RepID=UPI003F9A91ED